MEEHLGRGAAVELHLPELTRAQAIMLMDNLPRLRREPIATKLAVYRKVGGHPKSIELLEGWLASGKVTDLLADPSLDGMLAQQWADYFLRALLAQLTAAERDALARLCIFETSLDQEAFDYAEIKPEWVRRWLDLSLVQRAGGGMPDIPAAMLPVWEMLPESEKRKLAPPEAYTVHPVVRESLVGRMTKDERRRAHEWAAAYYGRPFVEMARRYAGSNRREAGRRSRSRRFARNATASWGRWWPAPTTWPRPAPRWAAAWRGATTSSPPGSTRRPSEIVTAVYDILARWGERDRAKALLRGEHRDAGGRRQGRRPGQPGHAADGRGQAGRGAGDLRGGLPHFRGGRGQAADGRGAGAMSIVYQTSWAITTRPSRCRSAALVLRQERGDEEGQAISLHQLSMLYMLKEDYAAALARSQEAEALVRKLGNEADVAATLHEQGLIYNLPGPRRGRPTTRPRATARPPSSASPRAWRSTGASGTRPARPTRWASWASCGWTPGGCGRRSRRSMNALRSTSGWAIRSRWASAWNTWAPSTNARASYAAALEKYQQALELLRKYGSPQEQAIEKQHIARVRGKMGNG